METVWGQWRDTHMCNQRRPPSANNQSVRLRANEYIGKQYISGTYTPTLSFNVTPRSRLSNMRDRLQNTAAFIHALNESCNEERDQTGPHGTTRHDIHNFQTMMPAHHGLPQMPIHNRNGQTIRDTGQDTQKRWPA